MTQASNLGKGGSNFNSTGQLSLTTGVTGILPVANGGTGSSSGPAAGGSTTQVQYNSSGVLAGSSGFVFDGTNVGIGTSSPSDKLQVTGGYARIDNTSASALRLYNSTTQVAGIGLQGWSGLGSANDLSVGTVSSNNTIFMTALTERMRITSAGLVGIGTTTPAQALEVATASGGTLALRYISNSGYASIATNANNELIFSTSGNPPTERMRIDSSGRLSINSTSNLDTSRLYVQMSSGDNAMSIRSYDSSSNVMQLQFYTASNSRIGYIQTQSGTSTVYSTSSDYRLKENIAPMTGALAKVATLKPVTYTWKSNGKDAQGFIAHELAEVVPDCVQGEKDAVDAEGKPVYQGIDTSFLVATLTAAIQELNAKVDAQAVTITELKAEFDAYKATHP